MLKKAVVGTVVLAGLAMGMDTQVPALRAKMKQQWTSLVGWTEEARRANPVGFAEYARGKLEQDLDTMRTTRRELAAEIGTLASKIREQGALRDQAQQFAEGFRAEYQTAVTNASFPIEVRGAGYTQDQAESQVSMLLAEAEGYGESLTSLQKVKEEAETQLESMTVRINSTETQLATLSVKRELLQARLLSDEGEQLLAQVDDLMTGNAEVIAGNPVRSVRELAQAPVSKPEAGKASNRDRVQAFLAAKPAAVPATFAEDDAVEEDQVPAVRPKKRSKQRQTTAKPIFQQS